jgi:hypothetical protein
MSFAHLAAGKAERKYNLPDPHTSAFFGSSPPPRHERIRETVPRKIGKAFREAIRGPNEEAGLICLRVERTGVKKGQYSLGRDESV